MAENKPPDTLKNDAAKIILFYKKVNEKNKLVNDESNRLITWSLSVIGGSILAIISTSYTQPSGCIVFGYLLFAVGWISLGISIYQGESLTRNYIAGTFASESDLDTMWNVNSEINKKFQYQLNAFYFGIVIFVLWLVIFLSWFIFSKI